MHTLATYQKFAAFAGSLLVVPSAFMVSLLLLGIEPPLGFLEQYIAPSDPDAPHIIGSLFVLMIVLVLPLVGLFISTQAIENGQLKPLRSDIIKSVIAGVLLVTPLILLELRFGRSAYTSFPTVLFGILWLLPTLFVFVLLPLIRRLRGVDDSHPTFAIVLIRIVFLTAIALFWVGLVNDQMPCFLGVPNCD